MNWKIISSGTVAIAAATYLLTQTSSDLVVEPTPPSPTIVEGGGTGYSLTWEKTQRPYKVVLTIPIDYTNIDNPEETRVFNSRTTIYCAVESYVWTNLPLYSTPYSVVVTDFTGEEIHTEDFIPDKEVTYITVDNENGNLHVSWDLNSWVIYPRGYHYKVDPNIIPELFFRYEF